MNTVQLFSNPALARAAVIGLFGGAGLVLTVLYSRRGPMIYPVYAALVAALTLLLSRYPELSYSTRFVAALVGFMVASCALFIAADRLAARQRRALVRADEAQTLVQGYDRSPHLDAVTGPPPAGAVPRRPSVAGYAARLTGLLMIGSAVSAGVAFIAG